jgi:copper chaperone CopZ
VEQVKITIADNVNAEQVFQNLQSIGVYGATLNGNIVIGLVAKNFINPLRSVEGVVSVESNVEDSAPPQKPLSAPKLAPDPQPVPSKVTVETTPNKWSGVSKNS